MCPGELLAPEQWIRATVQGGWVSVWVAMAFIQTSSHCFNQWDHGDGYCGTPKNLGQSLGNSLG